VSDITCLYDILPGEDTIEKIQIYKKCTIFIMTVIMGMRNV